MSTPGSVRGVAGLIVMMIMLVAQGCTILPLYKHPNLEKQAEPDGSVGTYNVSLDVPWYYDFARASPSQAASCRRYLATGAFVSGSSTNPCVAVDRDHNFVALAISGGGSRAAALAAAII